MLLYKSTYVPASLALAPGDVIDYAGEYDPYDGPSDYSFAGNILPEMNDPIVTFRFDYGPPNPQVIPVSDLQKYSTGLQWTSMLVTIQDTWGGNYNQMQSGLCGVYLTPNIGQGEASVAIDNQLFPLPCSSSIFTPVPNEPLQAGTVHFKSVTGIVQYFGSFTISPRSMDDIVIEQGDAG
jgi:hypothetical protein